VVTRRPNIRLILSAIDLRSNIATIASKIAADHKDTRDDPVVLIIVLNGAFMFGADLARAPHARKVSCVIEFLSCATRLNDGLLSDKCDASQSSCAGVVFDEDRPGEALRCILAC
jgi:hypoxanthine-guanine phosphoribosyltransferase